MLCILTVFTVSFTLIGNFTSLTLMVNTGFSPPVVSRYPQRAEGRLEASPQDRNPCKSWQLRWMSHADARARISLVPPPLYPECPALRPHSLSQRVPPPPAPSLPWGPPGGSASLWRVTWNAWCAESPTTVLGPPSCLAVSTPSVPYA